MAGELGLDTAPTANGLATDPLARFGFRGLVGASAWLLAANASALGLGFLQMIVAARVLGPREYGVLALVMTYPAAVNLVLDSRTWEAGTNYLVRYRAEHDLARMAAMAKLCYIVDAATALLAVLVVTLTAPLAARLLLKDETRAGLLVAFGLTLVAAVPTGTSLVLLRITGRFRFVALQNALNAALRFGAVLAALLLVGTVQSVVWAYVAATAAAAGVALWTGRLSTRALGLGGLRAVFAKPIGLLDADLRGIVRMLAITNVNGLLKVVQRQGDVLLVGYLLGPAPAGFVRLARSFSDLLNVPVAPVYEASYPAFASLWRHRRVAQLRALARRVTLSSAAFGVVGALVLVLAGDQIIRLTSGARYAPAVLPMQLFAAATCLAVSTSVWHPLLVATGYPQRSLVAMVAGVCVQLVILLVGLPTLGTAAAGLAYVGFYLTWIPLVALGLRSIHDHAFA